MPKGLIMDMHTIEQKIRENIDAVINQDSSLGNALWQEFITKHPADIADFLCTLDRERARRLFENLPQKIKFAVFPEFSDTMKVYCLSYMSDTDRVDLFGTLAADEMSDLFALLSDDELKAYLSLLNKNIRKKIVDLMKFEPESAGGIMDIDVMTLRKDFTVEHSVRLMQRLRPRIDIHKRIFTIDQEHKLVGYINLEDLLVHKPKDQIAHFMRTNEVTVDVQEDREAVAQQMIHYDIMTVPVTDLNGHFLGVISSDTLVDVIVQEASEDVQKMAALAPLKHPYFETSFWKILWSRSYILVALLLAESFSGIILDMYEQSLSKFLMFFLPMLISAGGNTSSQTSAIVIQGMATGDIDEANFGRFFRRELMMACMLAVLLGVTAFVRVFVMGGATMTEAFSISFSLALLVMTAVTLGSAIPFVLKRLNLDPAFSAGPFLATILDILGVLIYCYVLRSFLF